MTEQEKEKGKEREEKRHGLENGSIEYDLIEMERKNIIG